MIALLAVKKYCCPYDDAWTQEVSIPLLSRKAAEDNLPARMPIGSSNLVWLRKASISRHSG